MQVDSDNYRAVYLHVPFCRHRCGYCDFTLLAGRDRLIDDFLKAIAIEFSSINEKLQLDTLFFGGGTPSHFTSAQLERLFEIVFEKVELTEGAEFSVEVNPSDITPKKVETFVNAGANRFSLGVQSFDAEILQTLERDHRFAEIERALETVRQRCKNISIDLIFAAPGQSKALWERTLEQAVGFAPTHLSTYCLTIEKGSAFFSRQRRGELLVPDEESQRTMYEHTMQFLPQHRYQQYEISNFAQPGFACRHNDAYWSGKPYLAFGPGASGFDGTNRWTNDRSVRRWMTKLLSGQSGVAERDKITPDERAREMLAIGLRRNNGVNLGEFESRWGMSAMTLAGVAIDRLISNGLIEKTAQSIRLTAKGRLFADSIATEIV